MADKSNPNGTKSSVTGHTDWNTLEECREQYDALFFKLPVMLHSIDGQGKLLGVSNVWCQKMGYTREEVLGRRSTEFLTEESRRFAKEEVLPAFFRNGVCENVPYQMVTKDGGILEVLLSATAEYDAAGTIIRSLAVLNDVTPLKQAERLIRSSQERLLFALEGSRDGLWDWDRESDTVFFSKRWKEMIGYDDADIGNSPKEWSERIHPDDKERVEQALQAHIKGNAKHYEAMHRLRCKDGDYKWILTRGMVVRRDEDEAPLRIIGTHTDMNEFKHIEEELEKSRASLAQAQSIANIGSWEWDLKTDDIRWSDETYRIFGLEPRSTFLDFSDFSSLIHPDDRDRIQDDINNAIAENQDSFRIEHRLLLQNGKERKVLGLGRIFRNASGEATSMSGTVQDVTERREAEEALRVSEEKFLAMSNTSFDALIMIDAYDTIAYWNPAAERMFGYSAKEAVGQKLHPLITTGEYESEVAKGLTHFSKYGEGPVIGSLEEFPARRKDGSLFPVERSVVAFSTQGEWYAVGMLRDITNRKEYERKLELLATTDSLTGLYNRRHFMELAQNYLQQSRRYDTPLSLVLFDVDHFKKVNDTYGHATGDAVLQKLAQTARECFRSADILGRIGGEEFVVCMPNTTPESALNSAERFREILTDEENGPVFTADETPLRITVSLGVTTYRPPEDTFEAMFSRADEALYKAKRTGRNKTILAP